MSQIKNIFDPFKLRIDHQNHATSTKIIYLEESNRVLCPLCLEASSSNEFRLIEQNQALSYIEDWFDLLDLHPHHKQLRKIVIQILKTILSHATIDIEKQSDAHNFIRILKKIIKCHQFDSEEFFNAAIIFSHIVSSYSRIVTIPFDSLFTYVKLMLEHAKEECKTFKSGHSMDEDCVRFVHATAILIKSYSSACNCDRKSSFTQFIESTREKRRNFETENKSVDGRIFCADFISAYIIKKFDTIAENNQRIQFEYHTNMLNTIYDAISETLRALPTESSIDFHQSLLELDVIWIAYSFIRKNPLTSRLSIKNFLRTLCHSYLKQKYEIDDWLKKFMSNPMNVELNHANVKKYINEDQSQDRIIFYLLINYCALKSNSKYYDKARVARVLKRMDPITIEVDRSECLFTIYSFMISKVYIERYLPEKLGAYMNSSWLNMKLEVANRVFCSETSLFFWSFQHQSFKDRLNPSSLISLVERITDSEELLNSVGKLLDSDTSKELMKEFLGSGQPAVEFVDRIVNCCEQSKNTWTRLLELLAGMLFDIFCTEIVKFERHISLDCISAIRFIHYMFENLLSRGGIKVVVNRDTIIKVFDVLRGLYLSIEDDSDCELLSIVNQLLDSLIVTQSSDSYVLINCMRETVLSLMYNRLSNYRLEDKLTESIAHFVMNLSKIDEASDLLLETLLTPSLNSFINWTLSSNVDLHDIACKLVEKILKDTSDSQDKATIACAFIHMLANYPNMLVKDENYNSFISLLQISEFCFNPLMRIFLETIPNDLRMRINLEKESVVRIPSPAPSIESMLSSQFREESIMVERILRQIGDDSLSDLNDKSRRIPCNIYASRVVADQHTINSNEEIVFWEAAALDVMQESDNMFDV